jgi:hypothetical protein
MCQVLCGHLGFPDCCVDLDGERVKGALKRRGDRAQCRRLFTTDATLERHPTGGLASASAHWCRKTSTSTLRGVPSRCPTIFADQLQHGLAPADAIVPLHELDHVAARPGETLATGPAPLVHIEPESIRPPHRGHETSISRFLQVAVRRAAVASLDLAERSTRCARAHSAQNGVRRMGSPPPPPGGTASFAPSRPPLRCSRWPLSWHGAWRRASVFRKGLRGRRR